MLHWSKASDQLTEFKTPRMPEKRPLSMSGIMPCDEEFEDEELEDEVGEPSDMEDEGDEEVVVLPPTPDLRWFFDKYGLNEYSQIAICRTHANLLAAMNRAKHGKHTGAEPVGRPKKEKKSINKKLHF